MKAMNDEAKAMKVMNSREQFIASLLRLSSAGCFSKQSFKIL